MILGPERTLLVSAIFVKILWCKAMTRDGCSVFIATVVAKPKQTEKKIKIRYLVDIILLTLGTLCPISEDVMP